MLYLKKQGTKYYILERFYPKQLIENDSISDSLRKLRFYYDNHPF